MDAGASDEQIVTPLKLARRLIPVLQAMVDEAEARSAADDAEADTRADADAALQALVDALRSLTVTGSGLVTGGGSLAANRVLQVLAASAAELQAGTEAGKAITPSAFGGLPRSRGATGYEVFPGGTLVQHGNVRTTFTAPDGDGSVATITFPMSFADTNYDLQLTTTIPGQGNYDNFWQELSGSRTTAGVQIYLQDPSSGGLSSVSGFNWRAEGTV